MQLVALMMDHKIPCIITENDADFRGIDGIRVVNPFG